MDTLIKIYEGLRLQAYKCPAGIWTIGYGNTTYSNGEFVKEGDIITKEYAEALLTDYLIKNIYPVISSLKKDFTLNQKRALASLLYNIGESSFNKSKLKKAILKDDWTNIFKEWNFGASQEKGLAKRRAHELFLYLADLK